MPMNRTTNIILLLVMGSLLPRTPEDVIVVVRSDLFWVDAGGQTEVSLEVVQKDAEGRWRIVRKASERRLE